MRPLSQFLQITASRLHLNRSGKKSKAQERTGKIEKADKSEADGNVEEDSHHAPDNRRVHKFKSCGSIPGPEKTLVLPSSSSSTSTSSSPLLSLPGEIRTLIYEYAVISAAPIRIDTSSPQTMPTEPALLQTCTQIRREAMSLYYLGNAFLTVIYSFDISLLLKWAAVSEHRHWRKRHPIRYTLVGGPSWENLLVWLRAYFERTAAGIQLESNSRHGRTAAQFFLLVDDCEDDMGMGWEAMAPLVERAHRILATVEPMWE